LSEEKRKSHRFKCFLPAEVLNSRGHQTLIEKATVRDFSRSGLKLTINFRLEPGSKVGLKLFLPEKNLSVSLSGEIMWSKCSGDKLEAGLKISHMDKIVKDEILNWVLPAWLEIENSKQKKRQKATSNGIKRHSNGKR
jgi:hypothetical protein